MSPETVYFYWDNPYLGTTSFKAKNSTADVHADCDDDSSIAGDVFAPLNSKFGVVRVSTAVPDQEGWTDFLAAAPIGPIYLGWRFGIISDPIVYFRLEGPLQQHLQPAPMPKFIPLGEPIIAPVHGWARLGFLDG